MGSPSKRYIYMERVREEEDRLSFSLSLSLLYRTYMSYIKWWWGLLLPPRYCRFCHLMIQCQISSGGPFGLLIIQLSAVVVVILLWVPNVRKVEHQTSIDFWTMDVDDQSVVGGSLFHIATDVGLFLSTSKSIGREIFFHIPPITSRFLLSGFGSKLF